MKKVKVHLLSAFTSLTNGGNPAGLVLNEILTEDEMLNIAKEVGFSETAFLNFSDSSFKIRYFTPKAEVDLCGHATIAAFSFLLNENILKKGTYKLETKAGTIDVALNEYVAMTQVLPKYYQTIDKDEIIACFYDLKKENLLENAPIEIVSTGLKDIMMGLDSLDVLNNLAPNFEKISELSKKYGTIGIHSFTFETVKKSTATCRNFAPLYDIPEESATGTASGALSCYLWKNFKEKNIDFTSLKYEQGYSLNRPSEIFAKLDIKNNEIAKVQVGGKGVFIGEKYIYL